MSSSSSDDLRVSPAILARAFGIVPRHLQRLVKQGVLPQPTHGKYSLVETTRAFLRYQESGGTTQAAISLAEAQRLLVIATRDKVLLANAARTGELLPASMVLQLQDALVLQVRAAVEGMPARHANAFNHPQAYLLLQAAGAEILDQVATWLDRSASPMFGVMAQNARARVQREAVYDAGGDDAERSDGAGTDRAAQDEEPPRAGDRQAKQATPGKGVPRARRTAARSKPVKRKP